MLRQSMRGLVLSASALAAGCGVSASGTGLGAEFVNAAKDAHSHISSQLVPHIGEGRFPVTLGVSRAKVKLLQHKVTNDAEKGVWLLLTMSNALAAQSHSMDELAGLSRASSAATAEAAQDVVTERTQCITEAAGWLSGNAAKLPALKAGPCLARAKQAAAILGK